MFFILLHRLGLIRTFPASRVVQFITNVVGDLWVIVDFQEFQQSFFLFFRDVLFVSLSKRQETLMP